MAYSWRRGTGNLGTTKGNQSGRSFSGGDQPVLPFHRDSNPPSPLTPLPGETPHPSRPNLLKEAQKNNSKLPPPPKGPPSNKESKSEPPRPSSQDSSIPSSQIPSTTTGLPPSKESSPGPATTSLLFQPPPDTARASTSAAKLDNPFAPKTPAETQEVMEKAEALDDIQNVDASFYARDWTLPQERDSLEKRVKFYASRTDLREYDIEDLGVPLDGSRLRFRVRQTLAIDLLDVMDEFESLLNRLRSLDPDHVNEPSWQADPTGAFIKVLSGARTFASINSAWKGLSGRFAQGLRVYGKYLTRAYAAYGAAEGEVPSSPATTTASVYQEMERYPMAEEKIKYAFGAIPGLRMPAGFRGWTAKRGGRDRFVEVDMHELAPTPRHMSSYFPPREPEANPELVLYEGPRPYEYTRPSTSDTPAKEGYDLTSTGETGDVKGKKREHVTFQGNEPEDDYRQWNYEPPMDADTGYQYEYDLDHGTDYPETPAPPSRGRRGGRRTSIYSFFGAPTPSQTPFGQPVIPPPLHRGSSGQIPHRRRSGFVDVNRAFRAVGGAPPPDDGGGDDDGDDGGYDRGRRPLPDPPRGTGGGGGGNGGPGGGGNGGPGGGGGGGGPPPNPPGPPGGPRSIPPHMRPSRPGPRLSAPKGGGGGPPGGPPGGSSTNAAGRPLLPPYGNVLPTINPVLKSSDVPSWNGDKSTAVAYFWRINRIARGGGYLPEALGYWLWQKLQEGSSIDLWYMTVTEAQKDWMQENSYNWTQGIADGYLGRRWVNKLASDFRQSAFRDDRKHRYESPLDYLNRRIMTARFLGYSEQGSQDELQLIIERIPTHWHLVLSTSTLQDTDELKERAIEFEHELVSGSRQSEEDLETSVATILKRYGLTNASRSASSAKPPFRRTALNVELSDDDAAERPASAGSNAEESSSDEEGPWEEILAAAYSVVQKKTPPTNKKYPFEKRNDIRTTARKPPPAPCFACGSPYHWNRECPHRDEYMRDKRKEGYVAEPGEAAREKAYNAAWAMVSEQDFEWAVLPKATRSSEERKTLETIKEEDEGEADEEGAFEESPEERRAEVLFVSMLSVGSRIEVIEEEYWHEGGALPVDSPRIMEYIGEDASWRVQPDAASDDHSSSDDREAFAIPEVKPFADPPVKLRARINRPPGYASLGTSVLNIRVRLGSLEDEEQLML
ncbi:hypothetical protein EV714DRAFT_278050 [Schizophyllum commune]